jgi:hypothetical protein
LRWHSACLRGCAALAVCGCDAKRERTGQRCSAAETRAPPSARHLARTLVNWLDELDLPWSRNSARERSKRLRQRFLRARRSRNSSANRAPFLRKLRQNQAGTPRAEGVLEARAKSLSPKEGNNMPFKHSIALVSSIVALASSACATREAIALSPTPGVVVPNHQRLNNLIARRSLRRVGSIEIGESSVLYGKALSSQLKRVDAPLLQASAL